MRRLGQLPTLAVVLAAVLLADLLVTAGVFVQRRNAPDFPDFVVADTSDVNWEVDPYPSAEAAGFSVHIGEPGHVDDAGRVTYRDGAVAPSLNATYAMAALEEARRTGDSRWVSRAEAAMSQALGTSRDGFLAHAFPDTDVFGQTLPDPWYSSQAQGLVLSALARLFEVTGERKWHDGADETFAALTSFRGFLAGSAPAAEPWLDVVDPAGYLWFEQFTRGRAPVMVLASHLQAATGIYDYQRLLADTRAERRLARRFFAGGLATARKYAPLTRTPGRISITSLAAGTRNAAAQDIVERQLDILTRVTGIGSYAALARLLDRDDQLPFFELADVRIRDGDRSAYRPLPGEPSFSTDPPPPAHITAAGRVTYGRDAVNPAVSARYAIAALDRYEVTGKQRWLARAEVAVRQVLSEAQPGGVLPYEFRGVDAYGSPLPVPWYSSEGQGLMLSALARLFDETGANIWRDRSHDVFRGLTRVRDFGPDGTPPPKSWLSFLDDSGYLWFETYAGGIAASGVIHGHLTAVLGIFDYWRMTRDPDARMLFAGGVTTIEHYLPRIRRAGREPWYAIGTMSGDARFEATVTRQLRTLARITGSRRIARYAR